MLAPCCSRSTLVHPVGISRRLPGGQGRTMFAQHIDHSHLASLSEASNLKEDRIVLGMLLIMAGGAQAFCPFNIRYTTAPQRAWRAVSLQLPNLLYICYSKARSEKCVIHVSIQASRERQADCSGKDVPCWLPAFSDTLLSLAWRWVCALLHYFASTCATQGKSATLIGHSIGHDKRKDVSLNRALSGSGWALLSRWAEGVSAAMLRMLSCAELVP